MWGASFLQVIGCDFTPISSAKLHYIAYFVCPPNPASLVVEESRDSIEGYTKSHCVFPMQPLKDHRRSLLQCDQHLFKMEQHLYDRILSLIFFKISNPCTNDSYK